MVPISPGDGPPPRRLLRGGERLQHLVGHRLLVGVTIREPDGAVVSRTQFCGTVLEVSGGVVVVDRDGEPALLPSDDLAYAAAPRGTYTLAESGQVVVDPEYMTTWDVVPTPPAPPRRPVVDEDKTEVDLDPDDVGPGEPAADAGPTAGPSADAAAGDQRSDSSQRSSSRAP